MEDQLKQYIRMKLEELRYHCPEDETDVEENIFISGQFEVLKEVAELLKCKLVQVNAFQFELQE